MAGENDIFALMKANKRLSKNVAVAKKVVARKDYSGPAGEVICTFGGQFGATFDGIDCAILRFTVVGDVPGQEDFNGERIGLFFAFKDDDYGTVESRQAELFEAIQMLGIDTVKLSEEQIKKALLDLMKSGKHVTIRCVKKKGRGENSSKTYTNYKLVGVAKAATEEPDFSSPEDDTKTADVPADDAAADDEWDDAEVPADDAEPEAESADYNPSDWVGFEVQYKPKTAPKPLAFTVKSADDAAGTVVLERNGKTVKANYADLILPED